MRDVAYEQFVEKCRAEAAVVQKGTLRQPDVAYWTEYAETAYSAYVKQVGLSDRRFSELPEAERMAWIAVAEIIEACFHETGLPYGVEKMLNALPYELPKDI